MRDEFIDEVRNKDTESEEDRLRAERDNLQSLLAAANDRLSEYHARAVAHATEIAVAGKVMEQMNATLKTQDEALVAQSRLVARLVEALSFWKGTIALLASSEWSRNKKYAEDTLALLREVTFKGP